MYKRQGHNVPHNEVCLIALVVTGLNGYRIPGAVLCPQGLALAALVVANHRVGSVQNVLGGAVILLQADGPCVLIALLEAENVGYVRTPEAVNALDVYKRQIVPCGPAKSL